ncbi:UDP-N-acetylenolpyruvoylglucosamine reductase [Salmonella enterica subsp. enterica]|uniref:UDP-N-acetylenolpyruvoylglucosamine reductase n=1 Tax=Salmonella enterica I TaxID=59201 RepID=A0A3S4J7Y7_SALET|nr:UDP-N-acetylenolpyruvoylglucosamine reductase [Salmonella enterica subsp. enterica]
MAMRAAFFKNPVVAADIAMELLERFSQRAALPSGRRLSESWRQAGLIDQCQLKGVTIGGAAVHRQQALVLINANDATSKDVVALAHHVRQKSG